MVLCAPMCRGQTAEMQKGPPTTHASRATSTSPLPPPQLPCEKANAEAPCCTAYRVRYLTHAALNGLTAPPGRMPRSKGSTRHPRAPAPRRAHALRPLDTPKVACARLCVC
jgi:hypothetical protein